MQISSLEKQAIDYGSQQSEEKKSFLVWLNRVINQLNLGNGTALVPKGANEIISCDTEDN